MTAPTRPTDNGFPSQQAPYTATELARLQRKTVWILVTATVLGGLGVGASLSVGALLLAEVSGSDAISGLGSAMFSAGAAAAAIPLARLSARYGRRPALVVGSLAAMVGSLVAILGSILTIWVILAVGIGLLGVASAVQLLSRFAATDLALPQHRARDLSLVVWSITVGAVVGPNLMAPGAVLGNFLGVTPLAGVFVFPFVAQAIAALVNWLGLRPDPWLIARESHRGKADAASSPETAPPTQNAREAGAQEPLRRSRRSASMTVAPQVLTIVVIAMAQAVMVGLMAMTPLHLMHHDGTPELVGVTLSLHIAGMYAFSPLFGYLAGSVGRLQVVAGGWVVLLAAVIIASFAGSSHLRIQVALVLLGVGWGAVTVAGAALLTEITSPDQRPAWQGRSDMAMNTSGALAGVAAGLVFAASDFSFLALMAGVLLAIGAAASLWLALDAQQRRTGGAGGAGASGTGAPES